MKKYKNTYVYPAIFEKSMQGHYGIYFPDLPGCVSLGNNLYHAQEMAKEALGLHLWGMEQDGDEIPEASHIIDNIEISQGDIIGLIEVWMVPVRAELDNRAVKKTLTIPSYLNELGEKKKVNFSHLLQAALKEHLGIK